MASLPRTCYEAGPIRRRPKADSSRGRCGHALVLHHSRDGVQPDDTRSRRRLATLARSGGMKFFVDTADIAEIEDLAATGLLDGVTTNPSLIAKSGGDFFEVIRNICDIVPGPVSAEVTATDAEDHALRRPHACRHRAQRRGQGAAHLGWGSRPAGRSARAAPRSTSPSASRPPRHCWRRRPAPPSFRPSWAASTISARTAWA